MDVVAVSDHPLIRSWGFSWSAQGRSPRTMQEMHRFVKRFEAILASEGGDLTTATRAECEQFIASHSTPSTRSWAWRSLRSYYSFLAEELDQPSPMARVKSPKVPVTDVTTASEEDFAKLVKSCAPYKTCTDARDAAIISLLWATGLRRSELANLTLNDVDLDLGLLVVRTSKTGKARRVPFDARATQALLRYLTRRKSYPGAQHTDALWIGKAGPLSSDAVRLMIKRRREVAGVNVTAHSFRRGWAAHAMGKLGVPQTSVMTAAGWQTPTMPGRYLRGVREDVMAEEFQRAWANKTAR
jgi:integrase